MHGIGLWHENGESFKVEYREGQFVREIDPSNEEDSEEEKKQS